MVELNEETITLQEGRKEFLAWAGSDENATKLLNDFLVSRQKFPEPQNNMDWWIKNKQPSDLKEFILNFKSKSQEKKDVLMNGAEKIYDDGRWVAIRCNTYEAMKHYGKGTRWCIAGNYDGHESKGKYYFDEYLKHNYDSYTVVIDRKGTETQTYNDRSFPYNKWCVCIKKGRPNEYDIWDAPDNQVSAIKGAPFIPGLPPLTRLVIKDDVLVGVKKNTRLGDIDDIPNTVKKIDKKVFFENMTIAKVKLPSQLEEIGLGAFCSSSITGRLDIPSTLKVLGKGAFLNCYKLEEVIINGSLNEIPDRAFAYCDELKNIVIEGVIKSVNETAFQETSCTIYCKKQGNEALIEYGRQHEGINVVDLDTSEVLSDQKEV